MPELPAEIAQLQERYMALQRQKDENAGRLKSAEEQLERLKTEAKSLFGVDDVDELAKMLDDMERANLKKRQEYEVLLNQIEEELRKVERDYAE